MRALFIVILAGLCAGCGAGGAIDYLHNEYGAAESDGYVDIGEPGQEQIYRVWLHKQKPKIVVQTSLSTAANVGLARGATYGAVDASPVQPIFERAALKYLAENKSLDCRISHPVKIHSIVWEFDYECGPAPAPLGGPKAKSRR